jgi:hypothetical protein
MTQDQVDTVLEKALAKGAGQRSAVLILLGVMLLAPLAFMLVQVIRPEERRFAYEPPPLSASEKLSGAAKALTGFALVAVAGGALLAMGLRRQGARATRVGRTVLDEPESVFSVQDFSREIRVQGVPVRTVQGVKISIDRGDELEVQLSPQEMEPVMEALRERVGWHAMPPRH